MFLLHKKAVLFSVSLSVIAAFCSVPSFAQSEDKEFRGGQMSAPRVAEAWKKYNGPLSAEFKKKNLSYPPKNIYLRAFKSQNELELWARDNETTEYKLVKTYPVCAVSGSLGPKRVQGDRQIPEGFYFIADFNPASEYLLSLQVSYPNFSDEAQGKQKLGGDIYIHGGCVTVGCLPMTNEGIQEIYTVCLAARLNGAVNIPVHIYPTRLNKSGINYLNREFAKDVPKMQFWSELKPEYDYFEKYHKLLPAMYTPDGKYID